MGYTLKSGLSKAVIYNTVIDHNDTGIRLPPIWRCIFRYLRNRYWLEFTVAGHIFQVYLFPHFGTVRFCIYETLDDGASLHYKQSSMVTVPHDYLLKHGMLR